MSTYETFPVLTHYIKGNLESMVKSSASSLKEKHGFLSEGRALEIAAAILSDSASTEYTTLENKFRLDDEEMVNFYEAVLSYNPTPNAVLIDASSTRTLLDDVTLLRERGLEGLISYRPEFVL